MTKTSPGPIGLWKASNTNEVARRAWTLRLGAYVMLAAGLVEYVLGEPRRLVFALAMFAVFGRAASACTGYLAALDDVATVGVLEEDR